MSLLILTVGTGTAGLFSSVAEGLSTTIRLRQPRRFWLVPSSSEVSVKTADLIREAVADLQAFAPWSAAENYRCIACPDDLLNCRQTLRDVIARAKRELQPEERLIVNATGGTKQMSVGAALAAVEEEAGELDFTVGQRVDGVVKTGTEVLATFDIRQFLLERVLREADRLVQSGAYHGAAQLLAPWRDRGNARQAWEVAQCLHHWQRLDYATALEISRGSRAPQLAASCEHLEMLAASSALSVERLGDLLANADEAARFGDLEDALARYYHAVEFAVRLRLVDRHRLPWPATLEDVRKLVPSWSRGEADGRDAFRPSFVECLTLLKRRNDEFVAEYWRSQDLHLRLMLRHETVAGHGTSQVNGVTVSGVRASLAELLPPYFPGLADYWTVAHRPKRVC